MAAALNEFELIRRFFSPLSAADENVVCGIGDDCALLALAPGEQLATSVDSMVAGRHFPVDADPGKLGWRCLAAATSDLAACGARPLGFTLALTLPSADESWLAAFASGLGEAARAFELPLVGGDTTRGPLTLSLQVLGSVSAGAALRRSGARDGDHIWVSGSLGDARAALDLLDRDIAGLHSGQALLDRYWRPQPRLALGRALVGIASAAIDVSDGLAADLQHILECSGVGADLHAGALPLSDALRHHYSAEQATAYALGGGDDYELCFTAAPEQGARLQALALELQLPLSRIGAITAAPGLRCTDAGGRPLALQYAGFQHF